MEEKQEKNKNHLSATSAENHVNLEINDANVAKPK
jgi:hypothetical protein